MAAVSRVNDFAAELALRFASAHEDQIDEVVVEALERIARDGGADRAYVTLYHDDGTFEVRHEWTARGAAPHRPALARTRSAEYEHSYALARRGEVFAVPDVTALPEEASAERRSFSAFGIRSILQVPITVAGEGIGLIGLNHVDAVAGWSSELVDELARVGSVIGVVLVRQRSIAAMRQAYEAAARANRAKDELLAQVSHELRTPLHAILGYAELLDIDPRSDRDRDALHQIRSNGERLLAMVEDLLAAAQPDDAPRTSFDVGATAAAAIADMHAAAEARRITVRSSERLRGATMHAVPGRVRQVVYCVLTGAIQTLEPDGEVMIDAPEPGVIRVALHGIRRPGSDAVTPLARALLDGHGTVGVHCVDARALEVDLCFEAG